MAWADRQAIWARWHEINRFAQAGQAEHLDTPERIVGYFALRCLTLAAEMERCTRRPEAEGPAPPPWTHGLPGVAMSDIPGQVLNLRDSAWWEQDDVRLEQ